MRPPGREVEAQRLHDCQGRLERGVPMLAKRPVELFARQPGLVGDLRHTLGAP